ncbi:hypothetical protein ACM26W_14865 [Halomonas sp. HK25]|uniref:hypothetical protein n=1 Tax=Halomonas sp. HK25 TaxID=3394321 RepID=UPI0039FD7DDB
MLRLTQDELTIEVRLHQELDEEALDAVVVPATDTQRRDLGRAAVGQAWMAWSPLDTTPKVIKFMPPQTASWDEWQKLLLSYRLALRVADRHEVASLALPLPQQAGLPPLQDRQAGGLALALLAMCRKRHHLRRLQLVASGNQEAVLYANWLLEVESGGAPSLEQSFQGLLS